MIIVGYQGIGKSTLAKNGNGFIDLESSNFFVNGVRQNDWYIPYCNIAMNLSEQGYTVFVSSHECVRNYLSFHADQARLVIVCPSLRLKDQWIEKLEKRYQDTGLVKDYKAMMNAKDRYEENIKELMNTVGFEVLQIDTMDYKLSDVIAAFIALPRIVRKCENECDCFHEEHRKTVCYGTKEREECSCGGDKSKCNFYM